MQKMKGLFGALSSIFAAIPGIAVIVTGLGVPPGQKLLFGGVMEAVGVGTLLLIWVSRKRVSRIPPKNALKWWIVSVIAFGMFLSSYIFIFNNCVISDPYRGTIYYPVWTAGTARGMIMSAGSRFAAIEKYGLAAVEEAVEENPGLLSATT